MLTSVCSASGGPRWFQRFLAVPLAASFAIAACLAFTARDARAAGMLVATDGFGGVLKIKDQDVHVTINNGVAVTEVEQVFVNTEQRVVEALYTFPVPNKASVSNFSMWINGKEMVGEVVEKERARQIYNSYKQVRRDPGLLEQVDFKRFEMRIFPIPAGGEQRVKITYYQELDFDHDAATYVYPLATTVGGRADERTTGRFACTLDVKSAVPIVAFDSPSHGDSFAVVKHDGGRYLQASLETKAADLSRDVVLHFQVARPTTGLDGITSKQPGEDGYVLFTLTAGKELEEKATGADYVFVLDISGSMTVENKLNLSRSTIAAFMTSLGTDDRFEVMTFNIAPAVLFQKLVPADETNKQAAAQFLNAQRANGGTVLRPALQGAYRYRSPDRPLNVVILSDGLTEPEDTAELLSLIKDRPTNTSVFCVGVGNEVNRPLLKQIAESAGGLAAFLSQGDDFQRQAEAFRRKLEHPSATNVRLSFEGGDVHDVEPQVLPNLFHGQPLRIYARYGKPGPVSVRLQADVQGNPLDQTVKFDLPAKDAGNPQIERMWAAHRVNRLLEESRANGTPAKLDEIVRLSEGYSIANQYASFIVLENDAEYRRWNIERRNVTRNTRDQAALAQVHQQLEKLREATASQIGPQNTSETNAAKDQLTNAAGAQSNNSNAGASSGPAATPNDTIPRVIDPINTPNASPNSSGGHGGGGAIDPVTAIVAMILAGLGWGSRRRHA